MPPHKFSGNDNITPDHTPFVLFTLWVQPYPLRSYSTVLTSPTKLASAISVRRRLRAKASRDLKSRLLVLKHRIHALYLSYPSRREHVLDLNCFLVLHMRALAGALPGAGRKRSQRGRLFPRALTSNMTLGHVRPLGAARALQRFP
jgi:hypothetical protein